MRQAASREPNPDMVDRTRGMGTGGVSSDRIGFSRELTPPQVREVQRLRYADARPGERGTAPLRTGDPAAASKAGSSSTYGPDGKVASGSLPERLSATAKLTAPTAALPAQDSGVATGGSQLEVQGRSALADQRALENSESAAKARVQRESQQQERTVRTDAALSQAQRNGEAQNIEPPAPAATENAIARQRVASAYATVPRDVATRISLFA
jgi:hypothetical protein